MVELSDKAIDSTVEILLKEQIEAEKNLETLRKCLSENFSGRHFYFDTNYFLTTTVPAILSCQPCLRLSKATQIRPKNKGRMAIK